MFEQERADNGTSFRLCSLRLFDHPILHNISLRFSDEYDKSKNVYTTVIIGENGIGKSYLLGVIAEIFCYLERIKKWNSSTNPRYYFYIEYMLGYNSFVFANFKGDKPYEGRKRFTQCLIFKDGQEIYNLDMIPLPQRVIASATTIADKYVARSTEMYRYCGLRNESMTNFISTRAMVRKTAFSILDSLETKSNFPEELVVLLKCLNFQPILKLSFKLKHSEILVREDTTPLLIEKILNRGKLRPSDNLSDERERNHYKSLEEYLRDDREELYRNIDNEEEYYKYKQRLELYYIASEFYRNLANRGFNGNNLTYSLLDDYIAIQDKEYLKVLTALDLISYPSLILFKKDEGFEFERSSTGETNMICQMINIMSNIEPGSIILIDEPECSSHPNWQINYIGWLKDIFNRYSNCHFVISTHSHFLLTDLEPKSSSIIALSQSDGVLRDVAMGMNTYTWSVDDILYRVFHVRNTRNRVFESKLISLYSMISNGAEKEKVYSLMKELSTYKLNEYDPINKLLTIAQTYAETK
ncbi:MAG: AAA family ATPase [Bacteroidaceae bacterium]|nr:AAA family ATPase [Bacteroidaceae bacterium]